MSTRKKILFLIILPMILILTPLWFIATGDIDVDEIKYQYDLVTASSPSEKCRIYKKWWRPYFSNNTGFYINIKTEGLLLDGISHADIKEYTRLKMNEYLSYVSPSRTDFVIRFNGYDLNVEPQKRYVQADLFIFSDTDKVSFKFKGHSVRFLFEETYNLKTGQQEEILDKLGQFLMRPSCHLFKNLSPRPLMVKEDK